MDNFKIIEIKELPPANEENIRGLSYRKFKIKKLSAKASIKTLKLLIAKIVPVFDQFAAIFMADGETDISFENLMHNISFEKLSVALDLISDEDLDKLIDVALKHCFEILPANEAQVLQNNGTFGVPDIEDDAVLVIRLTVEALFFSFQGFFGESRLGSVLKPLGALFTQEQ